MSDLQPAPAPRAERPTSTRRPVLTALRGLDGRATLADVVAATGLARDQAEASLRELLEERRGHLEVATDGTLVYSFEPGFIRRDHVSFAEKAKDFAWSAFQTAFKVWIAAMLVVYFVVFMVLLVAALLKGDDDGGLGGLGGGGGEGGGHRHHHGHGHFPSFLFWYFFWSPDWYVGRRYYGSRWEERHRVKVPFYKKVFAFVFGPDRPRPTRAQRDRSVLRLIRARRGVLTAAELVQHTGSTLAEAEEELARLMVSHEGEVRVSEAGELVYVFPDLMVSAHGRVEEREPAPAWQRLEAPLAFTGNSKGTDLAIGGINAFNMVAAASAPFFIFPRLGLGGPAAWIGLVWVPIVFSVSFFAVPLARWWSVARENARRAGRNLRRVVVGFVYRDTLAGDDAAPVRPAELARRVAAALPKAKARTADVEEELVRLVAEFDGEVSATDDGATEYRFDAIRRQHLEAALVRTELALERREVGDIVYSSADTPEEAGRRELADFDRQLASGAGAAGALPRAGAEADGGDVPGEGGATDPTASLARYAPDPTKVGWLDDFELVAFDEKMEDRKRQKAAKGR